MAQTIAEGHHERGLSAFAEATDVFDKLHAAGLAIVPTELDDMVLKPVFDKTHDAGIGSRREELYRAMIAMAMKEQEGK